MRQIDERAAERDTLAFLAGDGEMGRRTRAFDWATTPLGPVEGWPQSLKTVVRVMLDSRYAMWLGWGPDLTFFYNDAYARMTLGPKHPWALGRPAREVWSEIWDDIGPRAESVVRSGQATWDEGLLLFLERRGFAEETYHTFSYSPVPDDSGEIGGMLCVVTEDTERTIGERRLRTLRELAARTTDEAKSAEDACQTAALILAGNPRDLPFALLYLMDGDGKRARLAGLAGMDRDLPISPATMDLDGQDGPWPFRQVIEAGKGVELHDLPGRFGPLPGGAWPESPQRAVILPIAKAGQVRPAGFLVAGVSPRRPFDDDYRGFFDLVAGQIATAVANARAYEEERRRVEELAELDRAKTTFFSNVSHEFRTPLTLLLGPVEDILAEPDRIHPENRELLGLVQRNALRLQRLVNTLLDFSRIEAGRVQASYEPIDLGSLTADLASNFRSACERAGLELVVDCPPLPEPVYVDRGMWEKVVLNLLSNAFKFTLEGRIEVRLRPVDGRVELEVRDTGTGIPAEEMPRLFERFHRVEGTGGRTQEGSGIGLALARELVRLHGGEIRAESVYGAGSVFTVSIPLGSAHLPADRIGSHGMPAPTVLGAAPYVEEALRWLPDEAATDLPPAGANESPHPTSPPAIGPRQHVLLADDNADMREYIRRLLADRYEVTAVTNGRSALEAARERTPDLVLSDVMMPDMDGFGLLEELRTDPRTRDVPVLLLSARAGEEARVEGLLAGADDYITKPFHARELLARVGSQMDLSRLRRETEQERRRGDERSRAILESITDAFCAVDRSWRFSYVNRQAERVLGRAAGELLGKVMWDEYPGLAGSEFERVYHRAVDEGIAISLTSYYPDHDRWYEAHCYPGQDGLSIYFRDVTERMRAEERERRLLADAATANAQFRAFFEQGALFAGIMHLDGTVIEPNRLSLEACGYTREEVVGKPFWECPWWNKSEALMERIRAASALAAAGETFRAELPYFVADGSERIIDLILLPIKDETGRVAFLAPTGTDVTDRKRAEEALRESERRFHSLADSVPVHVWMDDENGRAVLANARYLEYTGLTAEELLRHSWPDIIHPDDKERYVAARQAAVAARAERRSEVRLRGRDGMYRWFEVIGRPRYEGTRFAGYVGASLDVTDRRQAQEALREVEDRFAAVVNHSPSWIFAKDRQGRFVLANQALARFLGRDVGEFAGRLDTDFFPAEVAGQFARIDAAILDAGEPSTYEETFAHGDSFITCLTVKFPLLDRDGKPFAVCGIATDISASRQAERELRRSEERFRQLADAMPQIVWTARPDGYLDYYNKRWYEYTGLPEGGGGDESWKPIVHPDDLPTCLDHWYESVRTGRPFELELRFRDHQTGEYRWHLGRALPVRDESGKIVRWFGTSTDIHDRKRAEEALRTARDDAEQANQAKNQFLAVLSHELRTPLNPILLAVSSMLDRTCKPEEIRPTLEMIRQNVNLQSRLIDDLLDVMRIVRGKMPLHWEVVDCHRLIQQALQICRSEVFGGELRVEVDLAATQALVNADAARLQQVFWNLIKNAVKFTPGGGLIAIRTRNEPDPNVPEGRIVIEVRDTGIGIEPEILPKIFDPFQQGETTITRKFGGLGLGLAICKGIVDAHGGVLTAESDGKDQGTTFRVVLKTLPEHVAEDHGKPAAGLPEAGIDVSSALHILLVEDEPATLKLMSRLLQSLGHTVAAASTIAAAYEAFESGHFDLIVSDIGLPDGTGLDLMRRAVALRGPIPAIALTGYGMEDDIVRSREAGFTVHMTKPIDFTKLEAMIRQVTPTRR